VSVREAQTLSDDDLSAANVLADPERVGLTANDSAVPGDGVVTITLPPVSWTAVSLG
jgi:hypothetical protein